MGDSGCKKVRQRRFRVPVVPLAFLCMMRWGRHEGGRWRSLVRDSLEETISRCKNLYFVEDDFAGTVEWAWRLEEETVMICVKALLGSLFHQSRVSDGVTETTDSSVSVKEKLTCSRPWEGPGWDGGSVGWIGYEGSLV
ncbi:uncharacterized protein Ecym_7394 [Eremothecium cymbalariae DBVPG|uniref:Uncharacterized protein n=1 Tax=Eremothecium cymbalariae (strain CBS 270.75 / DBVPG 7215 / KCTC 17166 / NRRL Y-17582) TaxID=931890 RepID=G8JWK5_ERECY|nr:hypothetical protein Ecym_7394 [Eremothecium cymbalariae DBVPG\